VVNSSFFFNWFRDGARLLYDIRFAYAKIHPSMETISLFVGDAYVGWENDTRIPRYSVVRRDEERHI